MAQEYYFANGNEQKGPYARDALIALGLRPDTLVWREGLAQWQRLDSLPEKDELIPPAAQVVTPVAPPLQVDVQRANEPMPVSPLGYQTYPMQGVDAPNGMATASLVLGIIACVSICGVTLGVFIGFPCAVLAIIFGFIARGKAARGEAGGDALARAGLILGFIYLGLCLLVVAIISVVLIVAAFAH